MFQLSDSDLDEVLQRVRATSKSQTEAEPLRFSVQLYDAPENPQATDQAVVQRVARRFDLAVTCGPLFENSPDMAMFRLLEIPGVQGVERADQFDLARAIWGLLDARTVEPDLQDDYYDLASLLRGAKSTETNVLAFCEADDTQRPDERNWAIAKTRFADAWAYSTKQGRKAKGEGSSVFLADTGLVANHGELPANALKHSCAKNLIEPNQLPVDPMASGFNKGHGTATGSVIASPVDGEVTGAAPEASLVPIRCIETVARVGQLNVARAIDQARVCGGHVVNMSLGGLFSWTLKEAVKKAREAHIILVAAAGNCVGLVVWPARFDDVLAVAGTNDGDEPWVGSCRGPAVDISAPAEFVLHADAKAGSNATSVGQGTSFAAALTAAAAACWLSHHGRDELMAGLRADQRLQELFRAAITESSRKVTTLPACEFGAGVLDAKQLLETEVASLSVGKSQCDGESDAAQVVSLFDQDHRDLLGAIAKTAANDRASLIELSCIGLDRARNQAFPGRSDRPIQRLSIGLQMSLGEAATNTLRGQ